MRTSFSFSFFSGKSSTVPTGHLTEVSNVVTLALLDAQYFLPAHDTNLERDKRNIVGKKISNIAGARFKSYCLPARCLIRQFVDCRYAMSSPSESKSKRRERKRLSSHPYQRRNVFIVNRIYLCSDHLQRKR